MLKDDAFVIFITSATMDPPSVPWLISYLRAPTAPSPAETVETKPFPLLPDSLLRLRSTFLVFERLLRICLRERKTCQPSLGNYSPMPTGSLRDEQFGKYVFTILIKEAL